MENVLSFDWFILFLRIAFIVLLYLFLWQIVRVTSRELIAAARREEERQAPGQRARGRLTLIDPAESGLFAGAFYNLARRTIVGRHDDCDIVIEEPYVSGEHAELTANAGQWFLRDLGSTNGTYLNGKLVEGYADIHPGDVVQFGRITFEFVS